MTMTEKNGPEFPKQTALKRLRKEIGKHLIDFPDREGSRSETRLHRS